jgi:hypothetical protein
MPTDQLVTILLTAVVTGGFSAITTVGALRVHIAYLKEGQTRNEKATNRAHERIDVIDKELSRVVVPLRPDSH